MDKAVKKGQTPVPPSKSRKAESKSAFNFFEGCTNPLLPDWEVKVHSFKLPKRLLKSKGK